MAAERLARAGAAVTVAEAKPSVGRKFLMAGKSGLNLTKDEALEPFISAYPEGRDQLAPMLRAFGPEAVQDWARGLGREVFTGSTGRVFPVEMKASPLLRAWLARLSDLGVEVLTRWRWTGWEGGTLAFSTPDGRERLTADVTVLALGGASWARLGSDGAWRETLMARGVAVTPFQPSNAGLAVTWSDHMARHLGKPVKGIALHAGASGSRGEIVLSERGIEGGGIYTLGPSVRAGAALVMDLLPDVSVDDLAMRLGRPKRKASLANQLRKAARLSPEKLALLNEFARPLPRDAVALASCIKALPVAHAGLRPLDEAISTAGGLAFGALDENLMLREMPGVFAAGEMLDWDAPTGGYLITGCLATGRWAGDAAARHAGLTADGPGRP
jgi:hypothetical protein